MQNKMISQEEIALLREIDERVEKIKVLHQTLPNLEEVGNQLKRVHTILYLNILKDLITLSHSIVTLVDSSEEEFEKDITQEGRTLEEVERKLLIEFLLSR